MIYRSTRASAFLHSFREVALVAADAMANYSNMKHNDESNNSDDLDCQTSRQTHLPSAFKSYPPGDILFQGRMHTFIPR